MFCGVHSFVFWPDGLRAIYNPQFHPESLTVDRNISVGKKKLKTGKGIVGKYS